MSEFPKLELISQRSFGGTADQVIPRLLEELETPFLVAVRMGVYPGSIRNWLLKNGYRLIDDRWQLADQPSLETANE